MARTLVDLERDAFLAEAEALAQLVSHPSWPRYEALLTQMRAAVLELLAKAHNSRSVARFQGASAMLQEMIERPHQIVAAARTVMDEEAQRRDGVRRALDFADGVTLEDDL